MRDNDAEICKNHLLELEEEHDDERSRRRVIIVG